MWPFGTAINWELLAGIGVPRLLASLVARDDRLTIFIAKLATDHLLQPRSFWSITVRISAPNFSCMRCTTGSACARLRAPAPFAGRGAGFAATGVPLLTILNFRGLPAAMFSAV